MCAVCHGLFAIHLDMIGMICSVLVSLPGHHLYCFSLLPVFFICTSAVVNGRFDYSVFYLFFFRCLGNAILHNWDLSLVTAFIFYHNIGCVHLHFIDVSIFRINADKDV